MINEFNFETFIYVFLDVLGLDVNFYFYFRLLNSRKVSGSKLDYSLCFDGPKLEIV